MHRHYGHPDRKRFMVSSSYDPKTEHLRLTVVDRQSPNTRSVCAQVSADKDTFRSRRIALFAGLGVSFEALDSLFSKISHIKSSLPNFTYYTDSLTY